MFNVYSSVRTTFLQFHVFFFQSTTKIARLFNPNRSCNFWVFPTDKMLLMVFERHACNTTTFLIRCSVAHCFQFNNTFNHQSLMKQQLRTIQMVAAALVRGDVFQHVFFFTLQQSFLLSKHGLCF